VSVKKSIKLIPLLMGAAIIIPAIIGVIEAIAGYIAWYSLYVEFYLGVSAFWGTVIVLVGAALVMYGVYSLLVYLLTPDEKDPRFAGTSSFLFAGAQNTEGQGSPVPVGYGRLLVGSKVLSNCNTNVDKSKWEEEEQASDQLSDAQAARKATEGAIISAMWGVPQDKLADLEG
jgi:predicted phage tail protein